MAGLSARVETGYNDANDPLQVIIISRGFLLLIRDFLKMDRTALAKFTKKKFCEHICQNSNKFICSCAKQ